MVFIYLSYFYGDYRLQMPPKEKLKANFYRLNALPAAHPKLIKHVRDNLFMDTLNSYY